MSARKSPNNAFNLHKEWMKSVFRTIREDEGVPMPLARRLRMMDVLNKLDSELSRPHFYWTTHWSGGKYLFSKGYNNQIVSFPYIVPESLLNGHTPPFLIIKVREYYTDGVRAICAME